MPHGSPGSFCASGNVMEKLVIDNDLFFAEVLRMLREGRRVTIPVKGVSMLPFIRGGRDSVVLEPVEDAGTLAAGDIVLFRYGGRYILHRILKIRDGIAEIRGDGAVSSEHCPLQDICGRAVTILKKGSVPVSPYGKGYRLKAALWNRLPLRRYILAVFRRVFHIDA